MTILPRMSDPIQARIEGLVKENKVLLFMKGTPQFPQCGFSATCIGILDGIGARYNTVNVLADPAIRDGVKTFSSWPTIPQLYVEGEFLGGCDIMKQLHASGELAQTLASYITPVAAPMVTVTPAAAETLAAAINDAGPGQVLHLSCTTSFQYDLSIGDPRPAAFSCESNGVTVHVDRGSAQRLDGATIDFVNDARGGGFQINSPKEPPKVRAMSVTELAEKLERGEPLQLWDVRPTTERDVAKIDAARQLDEQAWKIVEALPKDTMLVLHCHHGGRSQRAAEQLVKSGFSKVYNLTGGIDAWSTQVDTKVPKY